MRMPLRGSCAACNLAWEGIQPRARRALHCQLRNNCNVSNEKYSKVAATYNLNVVLKLGDDMAAF